MHVGVAVFEICLVCVFVQLLLSGVHIAQIVDIVGIAQGHAVGRFRELLYDQPAVYLGISFESEPHIH